MNESFELGMSGRIKLVTIERARSFYTKIGFTESEDLPRELELTPAAAEDFWSGKEAVGATKTTKLFTICLSKVTRKLCMSDEVEKMTDLEIAKWQEELYELEPSAMAGPPMTEEEKMRRIEEVANGEFRKRMRKKIEARKRELPQEIPNTSDPKNKERLQRDLELLSGC